MRKFLLIGFLIYSLAIFGQGIPVYDFRVPNATTAFGGNVSRGQKVFNADNNTLFLCITAATSAETLTSASAKFKQIPTAGDYVTSYPGAGIPLSTGSAWGTSITNNSANWNTAYGWGNHAGLYTPIAHKTTEDAINGLVKVNGSGTYSAVTDNSATWNALVSNATHTGDATGATALTVVKINGVALSGLATGILKNTTSTGVPSIAIASDFPTLNQNTTGTAANVTGVVSLANGGTSANLTASTGGIVYSGASAMAILSGTATANKLLVSGANAAPTWSVPTFPNASATSRKMIVSDGTNWVASTETYATPGTSGNYMKSDGTNWTSAAIPTWNQNTTGTAAGLTAQYIDWNSASGGNSIANKPSSYTPSSHVHGNISNGGLIGTTANLPIITGTGGILQAGSFGTAASTFCQGNDSRLSDARTPTSHAHGNITNAGAIGSTASLPVITTTSGVLTTGSFGTTAGTFSAGDHTHSIYQSALSGTGFVKISGTTISYDNSTYLTTTGSAANLTGFPTLNQNTTGTSANVTGIVALANGGSAANLTASTGGIVYSGASAMAILSGTATANKLLVSGANAAPTWSVPTFPNASATARKIIVSDGTNWIASTETYAIPGTSGNYMKSDGTNWTSAAIPTWNQNTTGTAAGLTAQYIDWNSSSGGNSIANKPTTMTPASHTHGNITNAGYIGTTATLPVITGTGGILQAGSFGTAAGTFCVGNDARLSDARTPTAHNQAQSTITGLVDTANDRYRRKDTATVLLSRTRASHDYEPFYSSRIASGMNAYNKLYGQLDALNGLAKCNGSGTWSTITDNSSNWNTAYGWGNHSGLYSATAHIQDVTHGGTGLTSLGTTGQSIRVNSGATGYEFFTPASSYTKVDTITPYGTGSTGNYPSTKGVVDYFNSVTILDSADIHGATSCTITRAQLARTIIYDDIYNVGVSSDIEIAAGIVGQFITITARNTGKITFYNNTTLNAGPYGYDPNDWNSRLSCGDNITFVYDGNMWTMVSIAVNSHTYRTCGLMSATGGSVVTSGDYKIHTFTTSGNFVVTNGGNAEVLVVAGGGGGGSGGGGGGGGGGVVYNAAYLVANNATISVVVGAAGGGASANGIGVDGNDSQFNTLVADGGGGGSGQNGTAGYSGGSGGGGAGGTNGYPNGSTQRSGGTASGVGTGYNGGLGMATNYNEHGQGGGGGGAGSAGLDGTNTGNGSSGNGGSGYSSSITGTAYVYSAGGGAGNMTHDGSGTAGTGGTGAGSGSVGGATAGGNATNYGAGGGGAGGRGPIGSPAFGAQVGGNGGAGVVIIKYKFQ
ncbi:MAG: beta strand repeat-containing protein [Bacteroidales bacterium]